MERYLSASDPEERAEALDAFFWNPYPADPAPVILNAQSDQELLRHRAWNALENTRHPAVREFAISRLQADEEAFGAFCTNYERQDEALLLSHLQDQLIDFACTTSWHGDQLSVLRMDKRRPLAPRSALEFIFHSTYCSECRADALRQLGKRRMLTPELLEECLHDSNDHIRAYARRCISRRKPK